MKKGIALLFVLLVGSALFAQTYRYEDPQYRKVGALVANLKPVESFPGAFHIDMLNSEYMSRDDHNLYHELLDAYNANKKNYNAVMNYAKGLMKLSNEIDYGVDGLPERNIDIAYHLLNQAKALRPDAVEVYGLLDNILGDKIFGSDMLPRQESNVYYYRLNPKMTDEKIAVFEARVRLEDPDLAAYNYYDAADMYLARGNDAKAKQALIKGRSIDPEARESARKELGRKIIERIANEVFTAPVGHWF